MANYYKTNTQIRREARQRARRFERAVIAIALLTVAAAAAISVNEWVLELTRQGVL